MYFVYMHILLIFLVDWGAFVRFGCDNYGIVRLCRTDRQWWTNISPSERRFSNSLYFENECVCMQNGAWQLHGMCRHSKHFDVFEWPIAVDIGGWSHPPWSLWDICVIFLPRVEHIITPMLTVDKINPYHPDNIGPLYAWNSSRCVIPILNEAESL